MKNKNLDYIDSELNLVKESNLYRKLQYAKSQKSHIIINNKKLVNLSSNDYLGILSKNISINQLQSSSRLIAGNDNSFKKLEQMLARHKSKQASLIYPTGYMACLGLISSLAKKGDLILSDELNHASIIDGCKLSGAKISIYKHNDMHDLEIKSKQNGLNKFIITEGVFSMDGDISALPEITQIAQKMGAITIVDDAHGDFVMGPDGKGTPHHLHVANKVDVYISSLSKALGSFGGYIAARKNVIDLCINKSRPFIYTSALPSFLIQHATQRFQSNREKQRKKLKKNTIQFTKGLLQIGYNTQSLTHIIPIIVNDEKKVMNFGAFLKKQGIFVQPIRYPTVPKNKARLRVSITAWLSAREIQKALDKFEIAFKDINTLA